MSDTVSVKQLKQRAYIFDTVLTTPARFPHIKYRNNMPPFCKTAHPIVAFHLEILSLLLHRNHHSVRLSQINSMFSYVQNCAPGTAWLE